jgi:serine/threonine protein kinase
VFAHTHPPDAALSAYSTGQLDEAGATAVARHLDTCIDCRSKVTIFSGGSGTEEMPAALQTPVPITPALPAIPGYRVDRLLGEGGMGEVYLAHNLDLDRPEVLKVVRPALLRTPQALERFQQETRSAAKLHHANIVTAYSLVRTGGVVAFAMEYVPGKDLAAVVKAKGPLPVSHACYYARQAALGLQHAHENGMIHRDVKPHNLMLAKHGKKHVVKILDFGLAKMTAGGTGANGLTASGQMMGTPDYVAPEQTVDAARADIRSDVYSLGCTLYYLLTGKPPFAGSSMYVVLEAHQTKEATPVHVVRPEVPQGLSAVVARMMAKDPAQRYATPGQVAAALLPYVKSASESLAVDLATVRQMLPPAKPARRPEPDQRGPERTRRVPIGWLVGLAAGGLVLLAAAAVAAVLVMRGWSGGTSENSPVRAPPTPEANPVEPPGGPPGPGDPGGVQGPGGEVPGPGGGGVPGPGGAVSGPSGPE